MKFKKIIAALLLSALLTSLCACGKTEEIKDAVIVKSVDSDFWQNFKSGVDSAATEYNVSVTFEGPENEEDYAAQNKMISRAAENGADVIVLSAIDRTRNTPTVNAAVRNGVQVITADSALDSSLISLFIGTDNPAAGIEAAKALEAQFPADFISEAVDQTRGWFYSLLAISTLIFDKAPYKNVIVLGLVQDENGQKMSKSKGNAVDPFEALQQYGADAIRWYFYTNSAPWLPNKFHGKVVTEGQRKFMGTLWNTYAFYVLYAEIDKFDPTKHKIEYDKLSVMDKWLLSKMNSMVKAADDNLNNYRIPEAAKA